MTLSAFPRWPLALLLALAACDGCGGSGDDDDSAPDAGVPADAGSADAAGADGGSTDAAGADAGRPPEDAGAGTDAGQATQGVQRVGGYVPAPTRAILAGRTGSLVLLGNQGVPADPAWFGLPASPAGGAGWIRNALVALDTATGNARLLTDADGLPRMEYADEFGSYGQGSAPVFDLAWIAPDSAFAAAAWQWVVKGMVHADGRFTFTSRTLRAVDKTQDALISTVAVAGGELFVGTDQGVAVLDPDTLELRRWVDLHITTGPTWAYGLAAADLDGDAVAVLAGPPGMDSTHVALLRPGQADAVPLELTDGNPTCLLGLDGEFLVGVRTAAGAGEIRALVLDAGTPALRPWRDATSLTTASQGNVIPNRMAWDAARHVVLVGGQLRPGTGPGLVEVPRANGSAQDVFPEGDLYRDLLPGHVDALGVDAAGRWYVVGRSLCSEHKMRQLGVYRIEQDALGERRLVRPLVSGVRAQSVDPVEHHTWLGLRDEIPGLECDGLNVNQVVCRLKADGSCEVYTPQVNVGDSLITPNPGAVAVAFGDPARKQVALATLRDATWARVGNSARALDTQITPGLNLRMTAAAWGADNALWLGSIMAWETFTDPSLNEEVINARGPHGLGYLELAEDASRAFERRYVRQAAPDAQGDTVAGLPSNTAWDVLPLPGFRRAVVACGVERDQGTYDHPLPAANARQVRGGVALVSDTDVAVWVPPEGVVLGDVVKLAAQPDGSVLALDAAAGVFRLDLTALTMTPVVPATWSAPERGLALAVDGEGNVAVGTTHHVRVFDAQGRRTEVVVNGDAGYAWSVAFPAPGVLQAGTDQGLLRVALGNHTLPAALGPAGILPRELWPFSR